MPTPLVCLLGLIDLGLPDDMLPNSCHLGYFISLWRTSRIELSGGSKMASHSCQSVSAIMRPLGNSDAKRSALLLVDEVNLLYRGSFLQMASV